MKRIHYFLLLFAIIICSCKSTVTKPLTADFQDIGKFQEEFSTLIEAEGIKLEGMTTESEGKTSTELALTITNGKDLPTNPEEQKAVGKTLAAAVKKHLTDKEQFETYKVTFLQHPENDSSRVDWVQNIFKSADLEISE